LGELLCLNISKPHQQTPILGLNERFTKKDSKSHKINLGVGVFKDDKATHQFLKAVKQAEERFVGWRKNQKLSQYRKAHQLFDFRRAKRFYLVTDHPIITKAACSNSSHSWRHRRIRVAAEFIKKTFCWSHHSGSGKPTWANHPVCFPICWLEVG